MMRIPAFLAYFLLFALPACVAPPKETPVAAKPEWTKGAMVAAGDPRAVEAGLEVLRRGGTAVDAAIAVHAVLGLVEPQSSGIGGGAFMVYYDRASGKITVFDGRETAPASADGNWFLKEDGSAMGFVEAWQSGRSTGVPGQVALYKAAHEAYGRAEWASLFDAAITLAEEGFVVSPRLAGALANERLRGAVRLDDEDNPEARNYFYPGGEPLKAGDVRDNPAYAATLRAIAAEGPGAFYTGEIAEAIVARLSEGPVPSTMTLEDLAGYTVMERSPLCGSFRTYRICSAPPPSSGGVTQNAIMGLYERFRLMRGDSTVDSEALIDWVDAQRLAYADRDHYVADADYVFVPDQGLIDPVYLDVRAGERFAPADWPLPGDPGAVLSGTPYIGMWGSDVVSGAPGTTHISIVDQYGNAVAMTATVEAAFGNSRMVGGFLLNNELTDFSREPVIGGKPVANAVEGGKRPRSSMSPTLVFAANGELFMVTGSPGGNSIVGYVSKTLVAVLDMEMSAEEAVALPNVIARGQSVAVEVDVPMGQRWADWLKAAGYKVQEREGENSGLNVIVVREDGLEGASDPRREGVAKELE